jgi:hypothetical protein
VIVAAAGCGADDGQGGWDSLQGAPHVNDGSRPLTGVHVKLCRKNGNGRPI